MKCFTFTSSLLLSLFLVFGCTKAKNNFSVLSSPSLEIVEIQGPLKGGTTYSVNFKKGDSDMSGLTQTLYIMYSGEAQQQISEIRYEQNTYSWTVPKVDRAAKLRLELKDSEGAIVAEARSNEFEIDSTAPLVTMTKPKVEEMPAVISPGQKLELSGTCENGLSVVFKGALDSSAACIEGKWDLIVQMNDQGPVPFTISQTDRAGNVGSAEGRAVVDGQGPVVKSVIINSDDEYTGTPFVNVSVKAIDELTSVAQVLRREVPWNTACPKGSTLDPKDAAWTPYDEGSEDKTDNRLVQLTPFDGDKRVCAWAKDKAGNISADGRSDNIMFEIGNPPIVEQFEVANAGDGSRIIPAGATAKNQHPCDGCGGASQRYSSPSLLFDG